ncbi:hypothetical protein SCP_0412370 [Sparassis crispa]|uniref:Fungal-type protein kinase domain-containing protein n=1 Tax=Sparassis crispa TaxID=139825 RepID=A0A401GL14_9APHY|nr:hypothetical protein SCP_0412370 [Sparassis crispa]GBE82850.1 hypothetical protein SCP_0412370 [Sparassis crispa]
MPFTQPLQSDNLSAKCQSSPHKAKRDNSRFATGGQTLHEQRRHLREEMRGKFIVMPVNKFMDTFAPESETMAEKPFKPNFKKAFKDMENVLEGTVREEQMYEPLVKCVQNYKLCKGYVLKLVQNKPDKADPSRQKVDAALFLPENAKQRKTLDDSRPHWALQRLSIEFKKHRTEDDPFEDPKTKAEDEDNLHHDSEQGDEVQVDDVHDANDDDVGDMHNVFLDEDETYGDGDPIMEDDEDGDEENPLQMAYGNSSRETFETAYEPPADRRAAARGQIVSYANMLFSRQHRCFAFTILILRDVARIIRWDRAGTVVTNKFKYTNTEYLGKFLWRFCNMTDKQQGYDTTAVVVKCGSADYKLMEQLAKNPPEGAGSEYARESFAKSMPNLSKENPNDWSCWKLTVHPENGKAIDGSDPRPAGRNVRKKPRLQHFLVGKPHFQASGMTGRVTRGYIAYNCQDKKFVFLKDVWRVDLPDIEKEGYILQSLNDAEVANVPTLVCHGDVLDVEDVGDVVHVERQRTKTDTYWHEFYSGQMNPIKTHTHYRLVVEEVCRPLSDFDNALELVRIVSDCIYAHHQAMVTARIMHGDVSAGNILINETLLPSNGDIPWRVGMLCDWELSKLIDDKDGEGDDTEGTRKARQPDRTGTWQFMSVISLDVPTRAVEVADELEAFFNVFLLYLVRFMDSSLKNPAYFMSQYFDECTVSDGATHYTCGVAKRNAMQSGKLQTTLNKPVKFEYGDKKTHPCNAVIHQLLKWFKARYAEFSPEDWPPGAAQNGPVTNEPQQPNDGMVNDKFATDKQMSIRDHLRKQAMVRSLGMSVETFKEDPQVEEKALEEQKALANNLNSQVPMYRLLEEAYTQHADEWPTHDKVPDRVPSNYSYAHYKEKGLKLPAAPTAPSGSKRRLEADLQCSGQSKRSKFG